VRQGSSAYGHETSRLQAFKGELKRARYSRDVVRAKLLSPDTPIRSHPQRGAERGGRTPAGDHRSDARSDRIRLAALSELRDKPAGTIRSPWMSMPAGRSSGPPWNVSMRCASQAGGLYSPNDGSWHKADIAPLISCDRRTPAERINMFSPKIKGLPALLEELVTLIDSRHSGDGTALVVQDLVRHMRCYPEPSHA
jgi:hypothetical protein